MNESTDSPATSPENSAPPSLFSRMVAAIAGLLSRFYARLTRQPVLLLFVITFALVIALAPVKIGLLAWGICKLAAFAFAGDWVDSRIFPGAKPEVLSGVEQGTAWKRKGLIVAASIVAGALLA